MDMSLDQQAELAPESTRVTGKTQVSSCVVIAAFATGRQGERICKAIQLAMRENWQDLCFVMTPALPLSWM